MTAQEIYARAALVDKELLAALQQKCDLVAAEEHYRGCFWTDVRPLAREWRESKGLAADPLADLRANGYVEDAAKARGPRNAGSVASYA
jgi:L-rhamnose isomerase/sugar isomerase